MNSIPNDWIESINNKGWKELVLRLTKLSLECPFLESKILELVWLICVEDKRRQIESANR